MIQGDKKIGQKTLGWLAAALDDDLYQIAATSDKNLASAARAELIRRTTQQIDAAIQDRKEQSA